jgi:endo-beta-N-acetylglucosaminidase D
MLKKNILLVLILGPLNLFSQIINTAPYILTVSELKNWTTSGTTASTDLISTVNLASRFVNTGTQFNPALTSNMKIAYLPDGMNNFGNYYGEQSQFNLYNFTHWAYIDKLVWFGGTASQTVQIPSSPWVNAAHKNGVKVFGNVFFAPTVYGGSTATLQSFLEKDGSGNFIAIPKMIAIMQYYNFDGWFINQETGTTAVVAQLMHAFVRDLTAQVEALGKGVIWYDAMLLSGSVSWQNRLNTSNSPFLQNDADSNIANGFESRVSSGIFINFFWNSATYPSNSRARATAIGRSSFDVFTGADLWPGRDQGYFESTGNTWMSYTHQNPTTPYTSLGLFAPNCVYNNTTYSNFNNDPNDVAAFYSAERHMFGGANRNPAIVDATGFKGFSNWIPETSSVTLIPFETNFCTGHGTKKFVDGVLNSSNSWHNMNNQDVLPTWQFAFSQNNILSADWDFSNAYNLGNSLKVTGNLPANNTVDLMLYKTKLPVTSETKIDIAYQYGITNGTNMKLILVFADDTAQKYEFPINDNISTDWTKKTIQLSGYSGREIASMGLRFNAATAVSDYVINIGKIKVHNEPALNIIDNNKGKSFVTVSYPAQMNNPILFTINWPMASQIKYTIHNLQGKRIKEDAIAINETTTYALNTGEMSPGTYIVTFYDQNNISEIKKIILK